MDTRVTVKPGKKSDFIKMNPDATGFVILDLYPKSAMLHLAWIDKYGRCKGLCGGVAPSENKRKDFWINKDYEFVALQFSSMMPEEVTFTLRQL